MRRRPPAHRYQVTLTSGVKKVFLSPIQYAGDIARDFAKAQKSTIAGLQRYHRGHPR